MVTRMSPLFELSQTALNFVLFIGATAFFTGLIGIVQNDIKRRRVFHAVPAGLHDGCTGRVGLFVAVFHLMTHAFFKALLFLGAGSVIIAMHHEQDMRKMGDLRKYMPITFITMWIGTLALVVRRSSPASTRRTPSSRRAARAPVQQLGGHLRLLGRTGRRDRPSFYSFRLLFLTFHGRNDSATRMMTTRMAMAMTSTMPPTPTTAMRITTTTAMATVLMSRTKPRGW